MYKNSLLTYIAVYTLANIAINFETSDDILQFFSQICNSVTEYIYDVRVCGSLTKLISSYVEQLEKLINSNFRHGIAQI